MSKFYCPNCGAENETVGGVSPNFCFNCGYQFKKNNSRASNSPSFKNNNIDVEVSNNTPTENESKGFEGLDIEVSKAKKQSFQDILSMPQGGVPSRPKRKSNPSKTLEDYKKESAPNQRTKDSDE